MFITVEIAAKLLLDDGVVAIPTETVYGLAASLTSPKAIEKIYSLKGRSKEKLLPILVSSVDDIRPFVQSFPEQFYEFAEAYWPGALTLVIPSNAFPNEATAAFRIPNHPLTLELLKRTGPLAVTSANVSGEPPITDPDEVLSAFRLPTLKGAPCKAALPSTILGCENGKWTTLRQGELYPLIG